MQASQRTPVRTGVVALVKLQVHPVIAVARAPVGFEKETAFVRENIRFDFKNAW
jgi:hypothetical protein